MSNKLRLIVFPILLLAGYLLFWPVPIDPVSWQPPEPPTLTGEYEPNSVLAAIERLEVDDSFGPEDVAVDGEGRIYGGLDNGLLIRFDATGRNPEVFARTGGRPLGLHFDQAGNLIVADAYKGLLSVNAQGEITVLGTESDGVPFLFTDDLDIATDGTIYFTDASFRFDQKNYKLDAMEHRPNGRLLAYDPATRQTTTLLSDLYFANGVAISPDERFVLVNETWKYRVTRYWLAGEKKGTSDIFIDNLPGFPDGISCNDHNTFWLALASPRNPLIDKLGPKPFMRKVLTRLPKFVHPKPIRHGFVLGLDVQGQIVHNLQDPSGKQFAVITSVEQHENTLYLGSLEEHAIGRVAVPATP